MAKLRKDIQLNFYWFIFGGLFFFIVGYISFLIPHSLIIWFLITIVILLYYSWKKIEELSRWKHGFSITPPRFGGKITNTEYKEVAKFFVTKLIDLNHYNIRISDFPTINNKTNIASIFRPRKIGNDTKNVQLSQNIKINSKNLEFKIEYFLSLNPDFKKDINSDFELLLNLLKRKFGKRLRLNYILK